MTEPRRGFKSHDKPNFAEGSSDSKPDEEVPGSDTVDGQQLIGGPSGPTGKKVNSVAP